MPRAVLLRESLLVETPRVKQVQGLFDVPPTPVVRERWAVDFALPDVWHVGVVVGPSGSGKSTLCQELFAEAIPPPFAWAPDRSVLDGFPQTLGITEIVELLSSVGFSSIPSWLKPFRVLSTGEQFRVHLARSLAEMPQRCVIDEYTSVVDRQVAQMCSLALQKTARRRGHQLILATCHYDVLPWLQPDWTYEPHLARFTPGRCLQRPALDLAIARVGYAAWSLFKKYHYLSADLSRSARCFLVTSRGVPLGFSAWLQHAGTAGMKRISRTVVLPDYQGIGIGQVLTDTIASAVRGLGWRATTVTAHPARRAALRRSRAWRCTRGASLTAHRKNRMGNAFGRFTEAFEYVGAALPPPEAAALWFGRPLA